MKKTLALFGFAITAVLAFAASDATPATGTTSGIAKVARVQGMDKAPSVVKQVPPAYPRELREQGVQGFATVDVLIDSTGRVVDVSLVRATNPALADSALEAARQWTFTPAEARGQKIMTRVQVPFQFVMPQIAALEQRR